MEQVSDKQHKQFERADGGVHDDGNREDSCAPPSDLAGISTAFGGLSFCYGDCRRSASLRQVCGDTTDGAHARRVTDARWREEGQSPLQNLRDMRATVRLAEEMGEGLGRRAILL